MNSYFNLTLDTTAPTVHIVAPYTSQQDNVIEVDVKANESISSFQQIYTIDSENTKREYTFYKSANNAFIGYIDLQQYPLGILTVYATLVDIAGNKSTEAIRTILISNTTCEVSGYMTITEHVTSLQRMPIAAIACNVTGAGSVRILVYNKSEVL